MELKLKDDDNDGSDNRMSDNSGPSTLSFLLPQGTEDTTRLHETSVFFDPPRPPQGT